MTGPATAVGGSCSIHCACPSACLCLEKINPFKPGGGAKNLF